MVEEARDLRDAKHPYVTLANAKVHLIFSIIMIVMSVIQMIMGIVISEKVVDEIVWYSSYGDNSYYSRGMFEQYFYGDSIWISFVGFILAALGLSVWKTRSRSNGIMLSVMLFIAGFALYPTAGALAGAEFVWTSYDGADGIQSTRVASAIFTGITAIFVLCWAFYTSFHACCNSKVRKQRRLNMPGGGAIPTQPQGQQPQVVYVQAPAYAQQPGAYMQQPGGYIQQPVGGYMQQQPVFIAQGPGYAAGPPQYTQQQQPAMIQQVQIPAQVQHGGGASAPIPGTPDTTPPAYVE